MALGGGSWLRPLRCQLTWGSEHQRGAVHKATLSITSCVSPTMPRPWNPPSRQSTSAHLLAVNCRHWRRPLVARLTLRLSPRLDISRPFNPSPVPEKRNVAPHNNGTSAVARVDCRFVTRKVGLQLGLVASIAQPARHARA